MYRRRSPRPAARSLRARPIAVAALMSVVLLAGCGGGSSPGVANVGSSSTSTSHSSTSSSDGGPSSGSPSAGAGGSNFAVRTGNGRQALKFSECMRANGVPNFPDPDAQGVIAGRSDAALDPTGPRFQKAQEACVKRYIDRGGAAPSPAQQAKEQAAALALSRRMRSHGVPDFPDPTFSAGGGAAIRLGGGSGRAPDQNSPIFQQAQRECGSLLHIPPKGGQAP